MELRASSLLTCTLVWLAGPGCSLLIDVDEPTANRCSSSSECGAARCDPELGMCVADADAPYTIVLQFALPADESTGRPALATTVGPLLASSGDATADVVIRAPVPVAGRVRVEGVVPLDADLVFTLREEPPGPASPAITVSTIGETPDVATRMNDFVTELLPGNYDVEVRPRGAHAALHPPLRASLLVEVGQWIDIAVPSPTAYHAVSGIVLDADGIGRNGLEVRAVEIATGRRVSSVATTARRDDEDGVFELRIDPGAGPWMLRVSAPPAYQEMAAFPTIAVDPNVLVPDADGRVRLLVPSPETGQCFAGTVERATELGSVGVGGAAITLRSREIRDDRTGLFGSFTVQMTSRAAGAPAPVGCSGAALPEGGFEGRLPPGVYDIEVRPVDPDLGVYVEEGVIVGAEAPTLGRVFVMPPRTVLGGIVRRAEGEPVRDARVRAIALHVPLPTAPERRAALLNRSAETISGGDGRFVLPLDVGVFDLVVEPPAGSGYPWFVLREYAIGGSGAPLSEPFDLRAPVAMRGRARYDDGAAVAGAQIEAFAIVGAEGRERPVPIARATSDAEGAFLLLLPPAIGR